MGEILFAILSLSAVVTSLLVISVCSTVKALLYLTLLSLSVLGILILLLSHSLGLVYFLAVAGTFLSFFLFGLSSREADRNTRETTSLLRKMASLAIAVSFFAGAGYGIWETSWQIKVGKVFTPIYASDLGKSLFLDHTVAIILLTNIVAVSLLGAVSIIKGRRAGS
ncbi:hypothetical protein HKBW3S42_00354 [Candidatus Hakubella thermalkaliphila]|uniref:NADH-quinone oxidoreductase subunit J n=1 Tax=Candidatus Hakubella thermalkaliphila TaxID=2754717 RepID=A0A6V8PH76_9ACTN|nr:hypothetical protein HKBW3S42_00354 [Candidatus Hakubella thermalkaliphila]